MFFKREVNVLLIIFTFLNRLFSFFSYILYCNRCCCCLLLLPHFTPNIRITLKPRPHPTQVCLHPLLFETLVIQRYQHIGRQSISLINILKTLINQLPMRIDAIRSNDDNTYIHSSNIHTYIDPMHSYTN